MAIVLYAEPHWVSPYVFACFVALREKNLEFESRVLDASKNETRTDDYLASTITGRIPTLSHDGFAIAESSAIVEYLDDAFPETPVLPRAIRDRARARQLMSWMRSDDTALIRAERPAHTLFYRSQSKPLTAECVRAKDKLVQVFDRLVGKKDGIFDAWSIVDAELSFLLRRLVASGDEVPVHVRAWVDRAWQRPSVRAYGELARPAIEAS